MKSEYIEFLANLKEELLTQPTDGNRDPRYWGIKHKKRVYGWEEECAEGWTVFDSENPGYIIGKPDDEESVKAAFVGEYEINEDSFDDCYDIYDIVERANEIKAEEDGSPYYKPYELAYYRDEDIHSEEAIFLTKKAAMQHIEDNGHNYNNPYTYVMTAFRCPEYEKLLEVIKNTDWNAIRRDAE